MSVRIFFAAVLLPACAGGLLWAADDRVVLQLRWDHQFQFAGYYAAQWNGYYEDAGLDVEIRSAIQPDGSLLSATDEVAQGRADFGIGAADILLAVSDGAPLVVTASVFQQSAVAFFAPKTAGLSAPADLTRLRVSRRLGDLVDVELQAMLRAEGIDPDLVTPHPFDQRNGYLAEMVADAVDVVPGYIIGTPHEAMKLGIALDSLRPVDYGVDFYGDSLFTTRQTATERPGVTARFTEASMRGWEYALEHPAEIANRIIDTFVPRFLIEDFPSFVRYQIEPVTELTMYPLVCVGNSNPVRWERMFETLRQSGMVSGPFDGRGLVFDPSVAARARRERWTRIGISITAGFALVALAAAAWIVSLQHVLRRRKAQLVEKDARYRRLVETAPAIAYSSSAADGGTFYSPQVSALGYTPEELRHTPHRWRELIHPDDLPAVNSIIAEAKAGTPATVEYRIRDKDGRWRWFLDRNMAYLQPNGTVAFDGIALDITDTKNTEAALKESEVRHRLVADFTYDWELWLLPDFTVEYCSPSVLRLTGYSAEQVSDDPSLIESMVHPTDRKAFAEHISADTFRNGGAAHIDYRIVTACGEIKWVSHYCVPVYGDQQEFLGRRASVRDITERIQIQQALQESEERFRKAFNTDAVAIALSRRADGSYIEVNPGFVKLTGYEREEIIGHTSHELDIIGSERRKTMVGKLNREGRLANQELTFPAKNGELRTIVYSIETITVNGESCMLTTSVDITDHKRDQLAKDKIRSQLARSQRMESVGRLAGGVAHDFNNMLEVVIGHADLAADELDADHSAQPHLDEIQRAAEHSAALVRQLLGFARRQPAVPKILDLNGAIDGMMTMLRMLLGEGITLEWVPGSNVWPVRIDPGQLDQIITGICVHARDSLSGVGAIRVATKNASFDRAACEGNADLIPGAYAAIVINDNGPAVDSEALGDLFEPFFATNKALASHGLGLATVYGIVRQNEGCVTAGGERGRGTVISVYLPRNGGPAVASLHSDAHTSMDTAGTVLLAESDDSMLWLEKSTLERCGCRVLTARTAREAIHEAEAHEDTIRVLIADIALAESDHRRFAERIRTLEPGVKLIFTTGEASTVIRDRRLLRDGVQFLQKPFSPNVLAHMVLRELGAEDVETNHQ